MSEREVRQLTPEALVGVILQKAEKLLVSENSYVKIVIPQSKASNEAVSQLAGLIRDYYMISVAGCNLCEKHKEEPLPSVVFLANSLAAIQAAQKKYFPILESEGYDIRMVRKLALIV